MERFLSFGTPIPLTSGDRAGHRGITSVHPRRTHRSFRLTILVVWIASAFIVGGWLRPMSPGTGSDSGVVAAPPGPTARVDATSPAPSPSASRSPAASASVGPAGAITGSSHGTVGSNGGSAAGSPPPPELPACRFGDTSTRLEPGGDPALAVLDTDVRLPRGYAPTDLVPVSRAGLPGGGSVRKIILGDLTDLATAATAAGVPLTVRSAYRSETRRAACSRGGSAHRAPRPPVDRARGPATRSTELGTTLDVAAGGVAPWSMDFGDSKTGRWLAAHSVEFGFVVSYPKGATATTCYAAEPWHIRWIGRARAAAVDASGLTLREWLWRHAGD